MSAPADLSSLRSEFDRLLATSRRRVHRTRLLKHLRLGVGRALTAMVCVAAAYVLVRAGFVLAQEAVPVEWEVYGGLLVMAVVLPVFVAAVRGLRDRASWRESAERLDLGAGNHNRVAIGLALVEAGSVTAFGRAAISDGLGQLRRIHGERPYRDASRPQWRRNAWLAVAVVALTAAGWVCGEAAMRVAVSSPPAVADGPDVVRKPGRDVTPDRRRPDEGIAPQPETKMAGGKHGTAVEVAMTSFAKPLETSSSGRTGGGAAAKARASDRSARAGGESTDTSSPSRKEGEPRKGKPQRPKKSRVAGKKSTDGQDEGSMVSQGSSGGGTMSPVHHSWSQREQSGQEDREEEPSAEEEEVEDESESSRQRGGIQPSLKDRNESPSRELGISGEEGPPGTGRGGPTPPKKSRGTASLVLGVPIPDFVKGRTGPGMTKITHERVEPSVMPGEPTRTVAVKPRMLPEEPCRRFELPPAFVAIVREYLVALHSADETVSGTAP